MGEIKLGKSKGKEAEIGATEGQETAIKSGTSLGLLDEGVGETGITSISLIVIARSRVPGYNRQGATGTNG